MIETASRENHFVPQFYLRYFSADGKRINLFNFSLNRTITGTSIKHQCSSHNFYDFAPQLERDFSEIEGKAAEVIRGIKAAADIPGERSDDWAALLVYIVFQKLRTTTAAKLNDTMADGFVRFLLENTTAFENIDPTDFKPKNVYSVAAPLSMAGEILPFASDLRGHLFINTTVCEFITSDDPVVMHNQYCEGITFRGVTGWACTGLQLFWPISPRELIVLYDHETYKIGRSHRGSTVSEISEENDVAQLNTLQILNAHHNVYFAGFNGASKAEGECKRLSHKRPRTRTTFVETEAKQTGSRESIAFVLSYEPLLPVKLGVSKINVRRDRRRVPLHNRAMMYRKDIPRTKENLATYGDIPPGRYDVKKISNF